jgi:hypothetical protein
VKAATLSPSEALALVEEHAAAAPRETLPALIGDLERVRVAAEARLTAPAPAEEDRLIKADEAARLLGIAPKTLLRNAEVFPFTVRPVPGSVRFSVMGLQDYLRRKRGKRL